MKIKQSGRRAEREGGYTVTELLDVVAELTGFFIWIVVPILLLTMGNFWFTDAGVLGALQVDYPASAKILKVERNVVGYSVITAESKDGTRSVHLLDSNILYNYRFPK